MHNEKGQQVDESNNTGLYPKKIQAKWDILCPKMAHPYNYGSALRILLRFCRITRANRYIKILLLFEKKVHFGQFDLFSLEAIFYCLIGHGWNWAGSLLLLDP